MKKSLNQYITLRLLFKDVGLTQSYIKKEFKKFLYNVDYTSLWMYVDDKEKYYEDITWDGKFYWDKSHYEEIWNDLKNCRFIEKELEEDF